MTPMIDVVFLLIIFFLVSSHLARREVRLELDLPTATSSQPDAASSTRLTVNVQSDGATLLGAIPVNSAELLERLQKEARDHKGDLRVRVRGDQSTNYGYIEPVLAACAESGIVDISFGVFPETNASE